MPIELTNQHLTNLSITDDCNKAADLLQLYNGCYLRLPSVIKRYHDLLMFYCAFPADDKIYKLAIAGLIRIAAAANTICNRANIKMKKSLMASGIAHTSLLCSYSSTIAGWLVKKFPADVGLGFSEASEDTVRNIIQALAPAIEYEKTSQRDLGLSARLKYISGLHSPADLLKCLIQFFEDSHLPGPVKEELYRQLKVYVRWNLNDAFFNKTFLRLPVKNIYYHADFIKKVNSTAIVLQKTGSPVSLSAPGKNLLLDTIKASLAFQYRETDPITYAGKEALELFEMGRGLQIALVGMKKEKRLALESYIGFMAIKNGVPVSYGGGWIWGQRCKIGINIFPPFRRGESALLFCQVMRLYYQHFGVRHFVVKPYQFGKGNPEGLKSGAFWFYYKSGFRPSNDAINRDAALEWEKIQTTKNYSTPQKTLQHFTACTLELAFSKRTFPSFDAGKISGAVSNMINRKYSSNRKAAIEDCTMKMRLNFPVGSLMQHSFYQQQVLENWSLLAGLIDDIEHWKIPEKRALVYLVKTKQSGKERDYITRLQKHERLWKSLQHIFAT